MGGGREGSGRAGQDGSDEERRGWGGERESRANFKRVRACVRHAALRAGRGWEAPPRTSRPSEETRRGVGPRGAALPPQRLEPAPRRL